MKRKLLLLVAVCFTATALAAQPHSRVLIRGTAGYTSDGVKPHADLMEGRVALRSLVISPSVEFFLSDSFRSGQMSDTMTTLCARCTKI